MCGIVGYIGKKEALPVLLGGLKMLEYRGYDSAGVAILSDNGVAIKKAVGQVANLEKVTQNLPGTMGIAHTRWATHGVPNEANAHPHVDCANRIFVVHNGIIENYQELKTYLTEKGHAFASETDTEVVSHLIEEYLKQEADFTSAFLSALKMIRGAYALVVMDAKNPDALYAAKLSSPLVIGIGSGEYFVASDPSALLEYTKDALRQQ